MSPLFYITDNAVRSTVRPAFPIRKKTAFPQSTRHGGKPVAIPVPTSPPCLSPQAEKSGRQFVPLFLSEKKRRFPSSTRYDSHKPLQYTFRVSPPCLSPQAEKSGRQFVPLFLSEKKRFSCNQPARRQTRCNTRPDFSSPSQSTAYLVSFKFYTLYFLSAGCVFSFFSQILFRRRTLIILC